MSPEQSQDVLESVHAELVSLARRIARLEEASSPPAAAPRRRNDDDPLGPLFDALESINAELTSFSARLARLEDDPVGRTRRRPHFPLPVTSPAGSPAVIRAARSRRARKAVTRA